MARFGLTARSDYTVRMRTFHDAEGRSWQVALLEGAYGQFLMVFGRLGDTEIRQLALSAASRFEAETQLAAQSEEALRAQLATAGSWNTASGAG